MGGEEKNGESESERERERDIVGSLSVCVGHMIRACVCARARSYVRSLVRLLATSLKNCATLRSRGRATDFYCGERVFSRFSVFSNLFFRGTVRWKRLEK